MGPGRCWPRIASGPLDTPPPVHFHLAEKRPPRPLEENFLGREIAPWEGLAKLCLYEDVPGVAEVGGALEVEGLKRLKRLLPRNGRLVGCWGLISRLKSFSLEITFSGMRGPLKGAVRMSAAIDGEECSKSYCMPAMNLSR